MGITMQLLYLLLLYAVLSDGKLNITTTLLVAFGILLLAPCLQRLCCGTHNPACSGAGASSFAGLNNI
ncbi:MAG: hypothetical protein PHW00_03525 [Clostridia bacterium]|nr:hypothetical protein [Clostridia bacterium]